MKKNVLVLFLVWTTGTCISQEFTTPVQIDSILGRMDSLTSIPRATYDSISKKLRAGQDSLTLKLGYAGSFLKVPDITSDLKDITEGWMPDVPTLDMEPEKLLVKVEISGLSPELGDFGRLTEVVSADDPARSPNFFPRFMEAAGVQIQGKARDHFADKREIISKAMAELDRYKVKFSKLDSLHAVNLKLVNTMRGKSFEERLVPGIWFRMVQRSQLMVELAPVMRYLLTGRISVGIGWNSRIAIRGGRPIQLAYGPLAAAVVQAGKGFEVMVEYRNACLQRPDGGVWFTNWFTGLRKNFPITRVLTGFAAAQYDWNGRSLQLTPGDRLQTRMGVEFRLSTKNAESVKPLLHWKSITSRSISNRIRLPIPGRTPGIQ